MINRRTTPNFPTLRTDGDGVGQVRVGPVAVDVAPKHDEAVYSRIQVAGKVPGAAAVIGNGRGVSLLLPSAAAGVDQVGAQPEGGISCMATAEGGEAVGRRLRALSPSSEAAEPLSDTACSQLHTSPLPCGCCPPGSELGLNSGRRQVMVARPTVPTTASRRGWPGRPTSRLPVVAAVADTAVICALLSLMAVTRMV